MKPENLAKMLAYISKPHTDYPMVDAMGLANEDFDEMILRLGRKLSYLKAIRGPVEPESSKASKLEPKWQGGA